MSTEIATISRLDGYTDRTGLFRPMQTQPLVDLLFEYAATREKVEALAEVLDGEDAKGLVNYFVEVRNQVYKVAKLERAIKALDADFWGRAMALTDIHDIMPEKRRREWIAQLKDPPPFRPDTVVATLQGLIDDRPKFLAERVDGVFAALSGEHVTNSPWGFSRRMIVAAVMDIEHNMIMRGYRAGYLHDLRDAVSRLTGQGPPTRSMTDTLLQVMGRSTGEWHTIDGGAMRVRGYKKGTVHIEVHPEIAWKLNAILAELHPLAIPSEHRTRTTATPEFELIDNPIPSPVLRVLDESRVTRRSEGVPRVTLPFGCDKEIARRAGKVLEAIGGARVNGGYQFDYWPGDVIDQVITSGVLPDDRSHQYYPTPEHIADLMVRTAGIEEGDTVLEPSAGNGALVEAIERAGATAVAVEVSKLRSEVLKARFPSATVIRSDFLKVSGIHAKKIVMNPPFSQGRWKSHVEHAAKMLEPGGVLVALVPESVRLVDMFEPGPAPVGYDEGWALQGDDSGIIFSTVGERSESMTYPGVSIRVKIIIIER